MVKMQEAVAYLPQQRHFIVVLQAIKGQVYALKN